MCTHLMLALKIKNKDRHIVNFVRSATVSVSCLVDRYIFDVLLSRAIVFCLVAFCFNLTFIYQRNGDECSFKSINGMYMLFD